MQQLCIEGPVNIVKLEGTTNNNHKTIYLFMDIHNDKSIEKQTAGVHIVDFLHSYFQQMAEPFSFYMEIQKTTLKKGSVVGTKYMDQVANFFISQSRSYPNVKFYCSDVRDKLHLYDLINEYQKLYQLIKHKALLCSIHHADINDMKAINGKFHDIVFPVYNNVFCDGPNRTISKLVNGTNEGTVHYNIMDIIGKDIHPDFMALFDKIEYVTKILDDGTIFLKENMLSNTTFFLSQVNKLFGSIVDEYQKVVTKLSDLFVIKRFLDNRGPNKALVYTGISHALYMTYVLVKYYDFQIRAYSYLRKSPELIRKIIKKMNSCQILLGKTEKTNGFYDLFLSKKDMVFVTTDIQL